MSLASIVGHHRDCLGFSSGSGLSLSSSFFLSKSFRIAVQYGSSGSPLPRCSAQASTAAIQSSEVRSGELTHFWITLASSLRFLLRSSSPLEHLTPFVIPFPKEPNPVHPIAPLGRTGAQQPGAGEAQARRSRGRPRRLDEGAGVATGDEGGGGESQETAGKGIAHLDIRLAGTE